MPKKLFLYGVFFITAASAYAQELEGRVTVNAQQVGGSVDRSTFTTLQDQLTNFVTHRKWTTDVFQSQERIRCNFLLNIQSVEEKGAGPFLSRKL